MLHRPRIKFKERALRITTIRTKCEKLNQQHNKKELIVLKRSLIHIVAMLRMRSGVSLANWRHPTIYYISFTTTLPGEKHRYSEPF